MQLPAPPSHVHVVLTFVLYTGRCVSQFADVFEHAEINTELSDAASMHAVAVLVLALIALHHPEDVSPGIAKRVLQSLLGMVQSRTSLRVSGHAHDSTLLPVARGFAR